MKYTATIHRIIRDKQTHIPKVLLTDITNELGETFREDNHCYVSKSYVEKVIPRKELLKGSHKLIFSYIIEFEAEPVDYYKKGVICEQQTLGKIKNPKIIKTLIKKVQSEKPKKNSNHKAVKKVMDLFKEIEKSKG